MFKYGLGLLLAGAALGCHAEPALLVFGVSHHYTHSNPKFHASTPNQKFNENNTGLGLEIPLFDTAPRALVLRGGSYRDSLYQTAVFATVGWREHYRLSDRWRLELGLQGGYLKGSGYDGLAATPLMGITAGALTQEVLYIPETRHTPQVIGFFWRYAV